MSDHSSRKQPASKERSSVNAGARQENLKIEGKAVARILDAKSRAVVGHLYEWNTGQVQPKWKDDIVREDVIHDYG